MRKMRIVPFVCLFALAAGRLGLDIDDLVNQAKKAWAVVEESAPVVDYSVDYASAVPRDAGWLDLEGFVDKVSETRRWSLGAGNLTDLVVFSFAFSYACNGSYDGKGAFLDNVSPTVVHLKAAVGCSVSVNASIPGDPVNYGTEDDPVAGLFIDVAMDAKVKDLKVSKKCSAAIRGDCSFELITCDE